MISRKHTIHLLVYLALAFLAPGLNAQSLNENAIKASYILRFIDFIRWEEPNGKNIKIGLIGSEQFFDELIQIASKRSTPNRSFEIVNFDPSQSSLEGFQLLYIGSGQRKNWATLLESCRECSVITVGSETGFKDAGGLVEFVSQRNRLRFSLNLEKAESYNLTLSSKLIQLSIQ